MSEIEEAERRVAASLDEIGRALNGAGLNFVDAGPFAMGAGIGVAWSETFYAVVSVANFLDHQFNITYGVLRDINRDRLSALECANGHNQNLAAYPAYLHDAENGWDIVQQNVLPIQVLRDAPEFVLGFYLGGSSQVVDDLRSEAAVLGLGGSPYQWNEADLSRLLARSLI